MDHWHLDWKDELREQEVRDGLRFRNKERNVSEVIEVKESGNLLAVIVRRWEESPGIRFFTGTDCPLQLGWMRREKGHVVEAHRHVPVVRKVLCTAEVLLVQSGRVRLDVYGQGRTVYRSEVLGVGDVVLLLGGGHGLEVLEEAVIYEVKTGPYDPNDKILI